MKKFVLLTAFVTIGFGIAPAANDDALFNLRKSVAEEERRIKEIKESAAALAAAQQEFAKNHKERIASRTGDIQKINGELTSLSGEFATERAALAAAQAKQKNFALQFAQYKQAIKTKIRAYYDDVKSGFPYKAEERSAALSRILGDGEVENVRGEELFNNFADVLYKELNLGFDSEVYISGDQKLLRVGRLFMAAAPADGEPADGIKLLDKQAGKWIWRNDCSLSQRKKIRDAIDMVEGKKTPALNTFPISMSLIRDSAAAQEEE